MVDSGCGIRRCYGLLSPMTPLPRIIPGSRRRRGGVIKRLVGALGCARMAMECGVATISQVYEVGVANGYDNRRVHPKGDDINGFATA